MGLGVFFVIVAERKRLGNIASEDDVYVQNNEVVERN